MTIQNEIGQRLKELRKAKGLKQKDLAAVLGITPPAYGKFEIGERGISSEFCIVLADFYSVSCDYILRGIKAENLDICANTCLTSDTIECLKKRKSEIDALRQKRDEPYYITLEDGTKILSEENIRAFERHQVGDCLINELIQDEELINELSYACHKSLMTITTFGANGFSFFDVFREPFDAAQYTANREFASFFMDICKSAHLAQCVFNFSDDNINKAIADNTLIDDRY